MTAFVEKRKADYVGLRQRAVDDTSSEFLHGPYEKNCAGCGTKGIPDHFTFCGHCGAKLNG